MGITYNSEENIFHLQAKETSYLIKILNGEHLIHLYWGKKIRDNSNLSHSLNYGKRVLEPYLSKEDKAFSLDIIPQEYPAYGNTDFRQPAYQIELENGSRISDIRYKSHEIKKGKANLKDLPATYVEDNSKAETLNIHLYDEVIQLEVILSYTVFEEFPAITRAVKFINKGTKDIKLLRALSASIDFKEDEFEMLHLSGAWARERHLKRRKLKHGIQSIDSTRGASGPYHNPFLALARPNTDEEKGEIYGFNFVYSGNFLAQAQVNHFNQTRVIMGINPFDFSWLLKGRESFQTPEVVMVYSDQGINKMSQTYHKLYSKHLIRGKYKNEIRPVLINNWEATYFDFDEEKILDIAKAGKALGMELFVLDDGWFSKRNNDQSSLGDWFVNKDKIPNGLNSLAKKINQIGLDFGLWFEPEMISPDSKLYNKHPDWCIHVPNRSCSESRNQLILDLSRKEVCDEIIKILSEILNSVPITYVKWDMNRHMTEIGSAKLPNERQKETAHRYILGLYRILRELNTRFPYILFESCSSGGGRFDPGMLYYMPQTWTSDNTDAVERLKIQYGTSIVYPLISMGAHVATVPNHQTGRISSLDMRADVAMFGNLGYELDLTALNDKEEAKIKNQVTEYKKIRKLIQKGEFYRLLSPFRGDDTAWMIVSEDKTEAYIGYYKVLAEPNPGFNSLKLKGLNPEFDYKVENSGEVFGGDYLMYAGLNLPDRFNGIDFSKMEGDFYSYTWKLQKYK